MILGNRIPYEYFLTQGYGQSNFGSEFLPYETGSYDEALSVAGIGNTNIIEYSSVIPTGAKEITKKEGIKRINWGEVLECIKSQANGVKGSFISVGIMTTSVYDPNGLYLGGFACEYSGTGSKKDCEISLNNSVVGVIERRGFGSLIHSCKVNQNNVTNKGYVFKPGVHFLYESLHVTQNYGSVLVAICFISYKFPILSTFKKNRAKKSTFKKGTSFKKSRAKKLKSKYTCKKH